ncbi:MAG: tetratricopeptide repeat protein, partial [Desulfobacteraceae bacterium]
KVIYTHQDNYARLMGVQSLLLFVILLGPTLCWGAAFPLISRICTRHLATLGQTIGNAYAVNTIGAVCGSFGAGYMLIPLVGKEMGLKMTIALQLGMVALGWGRQLCKTLQSWKKGLAVAMLCLAVSMPLIRYPAWHTGLLSRGWYRDFNAIENDLARTGWWQAFWQGADLIRHHRAGQQLVFQGEGVGGFTTVETETTSLGTIEWAMFNSGKADASSHGDRSTQTLSGHIPLLFHPNARKIMVLGLASGMTAGEVLHYPVDKVDILEINKEVVTACRRFFFPFNNHCLNDPRTQLIIQDGRNHLALTSQHYDVIISEPSNPWMAGLANLYTLEFFQLAKQRLNRNGIFAQWIQAYEMDWETFSLLGRTFTKAFGNGALIKVGPGDYLLMGFSDQKGLDWQTARKNLAHAQKSNHMTLKGVDSLARLVVTEDPSHFFGKGPLHTDSHPRLEYAAPHRLYSKGLDLDHLAVKRRRLSEETGLLLKTHTDPKDWLNLIELGASVYLPLFSQLDPATLAPDQYQRYLDIVRGFCRNNLVPSYGVFADKTSKSTCAELHVQKIRRHLTKGNIRPTDHYNLGLALTASDRLTAAAKAFETTLTLDADHLQARTALGMLLAQSGRFADALLHLRKVTSLSPNHVEAYKNLGMVESVAGKLTAAANTLSKALRLAPKDVTVLNELGLVQLQQQQYSLAVKTLTAALRLAPDHAETHYNLGMAFYYRKKLNQAVAHFETALRLSPDNANVRHNLQAALALRAQRAE